jgi:hypothetical protein
MEGLDMGFWNGLGDPDELGMDRKLKKLILGVGLRRGDSWSREGTFNAVPPLEVDGIAFGAINEGDGGLAVIDGISEIVMGDVEAWRALDWVSRWGVRG